MSNQKSSLSKFAWTCLVLQICFGILFVLLVRYSESADAAHKANQKGEDHDLKENIEKYPAILDINMMLVGGFGFLMVRGLLPPGKAYLTFNYFIFFLSQNGSFFQRAKVTF